MNVSPFGLAGQTSNRIERLLVLAAFITCLGNSVQLTAAAVLVLKAEGTALAVGWLFIAVAIPQALLSLLFGRLVDRVDRRLLCLACDLTSAGAAVALPVWLLFGGPIGIGAYASNFALAMVAALFMPASNALIKERVQSERLGPFNANFEIATQAGTLLAAVVGGFVIQFFDVQPLFLFNAATFFLSAACFIALGRRPARAPVADTTTGPVASLDGRPPLARLGLLYALGNIVITLSNTLLVVLVIDVFRQGAGVLGVADALAGIGILAAAALYKKVSSRVGNLSIALVGYLGCAALIALEPFGLTWLLLCIPLAGLTFGLARIASRTLLMGAVPEHRAGRVFAMTNAFGLASSVAATLAISGVADQAQVRDGFFVLAGVVAVVASLTVASLRRPRTVHRVVGAPAGSATDEPALLKSTT